MKHLASLFSLLFIFSISHAQYGLQDAIQLSDESSKLALSKKTIINPNKENVELLTTIFSQYFDLKEAKSNEEVVNLITKHLKGIKDGSNVENPFIEMGTLQQDVDLGTLDAEKLNAFSSIGSLDVTNLALGLTDFLIQRGKTELNTAFFKRFKKELNKEENKPLQLLFPKTLQLLNLIDIEIYQYDLYLNNMRTAFQEDLDNIYDHMPEVLAHYKPQVDKLGTGTYQLADLGLQGAKFNHQGLKGGDLVSKLVRDEKYTALLNTYHKDAAKNKEWIAANSLLFLNMLVESFRNKEEENTYLGTDDIEKLKEDKTLMIYLGLLYEVSKQKPYKQIEFPNKSMQEIFDDIAQKAEKLEHFKSYAMSVIDQAKDVESSIKSLSGVIQELKDDDSYTQKQKNLKLYTANHQVFLETIKLLKLSTQSNQVLQFDKPLEEANKIIAVLENIGDLSTAVLNKQYSKTITQTALILKDLLKNTENGNEITAKVLRYGTFMAALVEANSPEEAQNVIEAAALPPGSYSIKRETAFSVALNGYIGGFYGHEDIGNDGGEAGEFNNLAITAPVGVSISFGNIGQKWKNPCSFGLSIPLIDLGTIASYRLDGSDNHVEDVPNIELQHLFAPGAILEFGIGGTPLTLGFGAQYGARLRKVEPGATTNTLGDTYFRYGLSLKVDIPLMQFYAVPAKRTIN